MGMGVESNYNKYQNPCLHPSRLMVVFKKIFYSVIDPPYFPHISHFFLGTHYILSVTSQELVPLVGTRDFNFFPLTPGI